MEDLPLVPAMKIIGYLSIEDVLNLKLVNKWFNQIINGNVRINDLVLSNYDELPYHKIWFYTCDLISLKNLIKYDSDSDYIDFNQPIFGQVRQLFIYRTVINLETFGLFDRLVHLEIIDSYIKSINDISFPPSVLSILRAPMLEIFNLAGFNSDKTIQIDSTKLQALKLYGSSVGLVNPESITYLEVAWYTQCKDFLPSCINLQHFYCDNLKSDDLNKFNLIKNLSELKSIHLDRSTNAFISLAKEKQRFNKDLKVYFHNLEFDELRKRLGHTDLEDFSIDNDTILYYAEQYSRLKFNELHGGLNFNDLSINMDHIWNIYR